MIVFKLKKGELHSFVSTAWPGLRMFACALPKGRTKLKDYRKVKGNRNHYGYCPTTTERSRLLEPSRGLVEDN